jgi:hypothetical protein
MARVAAHMGVRAHIVVNYVRIEACIKIEGRHTKY